MIQYKYSGQKKAETLCHRQTHNTYCFGIQHRILKRLTLPTAVVLPDSIKLRNKRVLSAFTDLLLLKQRCHNFTNPNQTLPPGEPDKRYNMDRLHLCQ